MKFTLSKVIISTILFGVVFSSNPVAANNDPIVIKQEKVTNSERNLVAEIFRRLKRKQTIQGEFFQTDRYSKKDKGALGFFYFQQPNKLNFTYSPPNPIKIISNGQQVLIKNESRNQNKYYPASSTPMKFLTGDPQKIAYGKKIKNVYSKNNKIYVRMMQNNIFGKADMTVEFQEDDLKLLGWTIHEKDNDIHIELYNRSYNKKLNQDLFDIEPRNSNK